ncbi:MAG TPA: hypothetical protein VGM23_01320, partial [Armatimonadota bacterium]
MSNTLKRVMTGRQGCWYLLLLLLAMVVAGCGGGSASLTSFVAPPQPVAGEAPVDPFYVVTANYFSTQTGQIPSSSQFANVHYPVPFAYVRE